MTIRSKNDRGKDEWFRYSYKEPGFVRIDFIRPHDGATLIYSPVLKCAPLWPFGIDHFPGLDLHPHNALITSAQGHYVDQSDVVSLFKKILLLERSGQIEQLDKDISATQKKQHFLITGMNGFSVDGVHQYDLWFDDVSHFLIKMIGRNLQGKIIETVTMENLQININFPVSFFKS